MKQDSKKRVLERQKENTERVRQEANEMELVDFEESSRDDNTH